MKMIDETLKFITFDFKKIDSIDQFSDNQNYTTTFKDLYHEKNLKEYTLLTRLNRPKLLANSNMDLEIACQTYLKNL